MPAAAQSRSPPACRNRAPARRCRPRPGFRAPARRRCACGPRRRCGLRPTEFGPGEIDIFEDAEAGFLRLEREQALDALVGDDDHFAGLQVAHEARADDVERTGFRRQDPGAVEIAQHQRTDAERVAARRSSSSTVSATSEKAPSTWRIASMKRELRSRSLAGRHQVQDRLGVGGRGEDRALLLQRALHGQRVGEVAVVGDGEAALGKLGEERLDVAQAGAAGGGIAGVADGAGALKLLHAPPAW